MWDASQVNTQALLKGVEYWRLSNASSLITFHDFKIISCMALRESSSLPPFSAMCIAMKDGASPLCNSSYYSICSIYIYEKTTFKSLSNKEGKKLRCLLCVLQSHCRDAKLKKHVELICVSFAFGILCSCWQLNRALRRHVIATMVQRMTPIHSPDTFECFVYSFHGAILPPPKMPCRCHATVKWE